MELAKNLYYWAVLSFFMGALLAVLFSGKFRLSIYTAHLAAFSGATLSLIIALMNLLQGVTFRTVIFEMVPLGRLEIALDNISAYFLLVISLAVMAVSIYSLGYLEEYKGKKKVGFLGALFNLFILAMYLVVTVNNALAFLIVWEVMSVASYFLVINDHQQAQVRKAGFIYIVMTHIGTIFIFILFLLFYRQTGSLDFTSFKSVGIHLDSALKTVIFIFALIGFGTKAGIIPLHIWLPKAHPVAPSHVSALMSGVMVKIAIYGIVRVVFDFLGTGYAWWGVLVLILGIVSALLGILYALVERDLKRLLAYSSMENIGIIMIGLGTAMLFNYYGYGEYAGIALAAGFYHMLNHAVFKSLLFMGAGSVLHATHTKDIEKLGGLIKKMPWTAGFFLVGALSISAIPPFNGFISEWLTLQSLLLLGMNIPVTILKVIALLGGALLALTGALAAATLVKTFGLTFLAMPRSPKAEQAREVPWPMRIGMGGLALMCLALGVLPGVAFKLIKPVTVSLIKADISTQVVTGSWPGLSHLKAGLSGISPGIVLVLLILLLPFPLLVTRLIGGRSKTKIDETWTCGETLRPTMEYTATSFSQPFRIIFSKIFKPRYLSENKFDVAPYFASSIKYKSRIIPIFENYLYKPFMNLFLFISYKIRKIQTGSIHAYLAYIFVTLVILLIIAK